MITLLSKSVSLPQRSPKNVVITGSTKGIGKSLAKKMYMEGHNVVISSSNRANVRNTYKELKEKGVTVGNIYPIVADVSSEKDCLYLLRQAVIRMGSVDIWINNAGVSTRNLLTDQTVDEIRQTIDVNLLGTILCCRLVIPYMIQQQSGIVINFEGAGSNGLLTPHYSVYGASKSAITQFTKSISNEYKDTDIRFCTISPGMVMTDLLMSNADDQMKRAFNIFCEDSDVVATYLVAEIGNIKKNTYIKYLTLNRVFLLLLMSFFRKNRYFELD
jgi:short-subunit dehydrogenase